MILSRLNDLTRFEPLKIVGIVELPPKDPYDDDDENQEDDEDEDNSHEDAEPAVIREPDEC